MKKLLVMLVLVLPSLVLAKQTDEPLYYGPALCANPEFKCVTIARGDNWEKLFPDPDQRDLVQRVNRTYNALWPGKVIAVPSDLPHATLLSLSPFPRKIQPGDSKQIIVDQNKLAYAAYDQQGYLVKWGPIASGADKCSDSNNVCRTMTGIFRVFNKENEKCVSDLFPIGRGGAKMPYCMYFHKGFALHGSTDIPGYRASHGCVRLFNEDAKWLNLNFVDVSNEGNNFLGTVVIVRPIITTEKTS